MKLKWKRSLAFLLSAAMAVSLFVTPVSAAVDGEAGQVFDEAGSDRQEKITAVTEVKQGSGEETGDFTVSDGTFGTDYTYGEGVLTILTDTSLTIANTEPGTPTVNRIYVESGVSANITLAGVNIDVSQTEYAAAFHIADSSSGNVTITLEEGTENTLKSGSYCAGLQKSSVSKNKDIGMLMITGEGALTVVGGEFGAGIGGGNGKEGRNITITSGTVTVVRRTDHRSAAGIGGGDRGAGNNITISGGVVTANGDLFGSAGIGGGGGSVGSNDIIISGGIVIANGKNGGAGVGTGEKGIMGTPTSVFSTGENGSAFLVASSITDNDDTSGWSGVIFQGSQGQVYGDVTLPEGNYPVPDASTLTITYGTSLSGNGTLTGDGTFLTEHLTENKIIVPTDIVYTGEDLSETISEKLEVSKDYICGQEFALTGWTANVERVSDLEYMVTYTYDGDSSVQPVSKKVTVSPRPLAEVDVTVDEVSYDGTERTPAVTVTFNGNTLTEETDYTVTSYTNNMDAGNNAAVVITAVKNGNYTGSKTVGFNIAPADISKAKVTLENSLTYSGQEQIQKVTVTVGNMKLTEGKDYTLSGNTGTNAGSYTVTVSGKGNYTGKAIGKWTIAAKKLTIRSATAEDRTYQQGNREVFASAAFDGAVTGETPAYSAVGIMADDSVGEGKSVDVTVTLTDSNYQLCASDGTPIASWKGESTVDIEKADAGLSVSVENITGSGDIRTVTLLAALTPGDATGTVTFMQGGRTIGEAEIASDGVARCEWQADADTVYIITAEYGGDSNYNAADAAELTVDTSRLSQSITIADVGAKTYGDGAFPLSVIGGGTGAVTFTSSASDILSIDGSTATICGVGTVTITAVKAADDQYNEATAVYHLTVGKKSLTVKADDQSVAVGSGMPELTYTVTGLAGSDTFTDPVLATTAAGTDTAGTYEITVSGGTLTNADCYDVSYLSGTLTVTAGTVSGGEGQNSEDTTETKVKKIQISAPSKEIAAGKKVQLTAKITPKNATTQKVTWKSGNKKYATVNAKGVVTTKKAGAGKTVTITATAKDGSGRKASVKIKIMKNAVTKVKIKNPPKTLRAGKSVTLKTAVSSNGKNANKTLEWTSSNSKYATVNSRGKVTAKKAGKGKTVTITAASTDGTNIKAKIKIKIK